MSKYMVARDGEILYDGPDRQSADYHYMCGVQSVDNAAVGAVEMFLIHDDDTPERLNRFSIAPEPPEDT